MGRKILLVSRCSWTLYNFRKSLIQILLQKGETVIGGGAGGDGYEKKLKELGISFYALPIDFKGTHPWRDMILLRTLWYWYRVEKPDIVHHFTIKPVIYGSIAARLAKVPVIINTVTGLGHVFIEGNKSVQIAVENLYRMALACAHFTFFQNAEDLSLFRRKKLVNGEKSGLIPGSGVNLDYFCPEHGGIRKTNGVTGIFLFIGRLLREKGIYEFVEAARMVKKKYSVLTISIIGTAR